MNIVVELSILAAQVGDGSAGMKDRGVVASAEGITYFR
jgi:hypothetical protein